MATINGMDPKSARIKNYYLSFKAIIVVLVFILVPFSSS
jgi:hypothetical protein